MQIACCRLQQLLIEDQLDICKRRGFLVRILKLIEFSLLSQINPVRPLFSGPATRGWSQQSAANWQTVSAKRGRGWQQTGLRGENLHRWLPGPRAAAVHLPPESTTQFCRNPSINPICSTKEKSYWVSNGKHKENLDLRHVSFKCWWGAKWSRQYRQKERFVRDQAWHELRSRPGQTPLRKFRSLLQGISAGFDLLALIYLRVIDSQGGHEALKIEDDQKRTENIHQLAGAENAIL